MDQYRINVTTNSESTMHKIIKKEFTQDMFEISNLRGYKKVVPQEIVLDDQNEYQDFLKIIDKLNILRDEWLETKDKEVWYSLIIMLPESWLQTRMITMNYENVRSICAQRQGHRLTEWASFIAWARKLPYADALIFDEDIKAFLKNIV